MALVSVGAADEVDLLRLLHCSACWMPHCKLMGQVTIRERIVSADMAMHMQLQASGPGACGC